MELNATVSTDGREMLIVTPERFDFKWHSDLRKAYEKVGAGCERFVIDMRNTEYMDSSALGMLLQLREFTGNRNDAIRIRNVCRSVRDILTIANFDKLMTIA